MTTYSFQNVTMSLVGPGVSLSLGHGADNAEGGITVALVEDKNTMTVGADGGVMHSMHAGKAGTITVRLMKTSQQNARLTNAYRYQTANPSNHGRNTITVRDARRGDVIVAQRCAFKKLPDNTFDKVGNTLEWVFDCGIIDEKLGLSI